MEKEQATNLNSPQDSYYALQPLATGADCFPIFRTQEFQQRIVLMLKASSEAIIRASFEGEVAKRKTVPRLFSAFGISRPLWVILRSQINCRSAGEYGPLGVSGLIIKLVKRAAVIRSVLLSATYVPAWRNVHTDNFRSASLYGFGSPASWAGLNGIGSSIVT